MYKKIFLLTAMALCLLASSGYAGYNPAFSDSTTGKYNFILEITKGSTENEYRDLFMSNTPIPFPGRGPEQWGPDPDNPGYPHFIERPGQGIPPFVTVVPEPVSYLLFIAGGALLAIRKYAGRRN